MYLGYGPQSVTLVASAGGTSYAWTGPAGLSSTSAAAPVFTATQAGSFTFVVTITNQYGCSSTASVTLTVRNVRCGNKNDKVLVCHNGSALCINRSDAADHLGHGDRLGACPLPGARPLAAPQAAVAPRLAPQLEAYPNPARDAVRVRVLHAAPAGPLQLFDALGRLVHAQPAPAPGAEATLPLTGRPSGLYVLRCGALSQRLTVE